MVFFIIGVPKFLAHLDTKLQLLKSDWNGIREDTQNTNQSHHPSLDPPQQNFSIEMLWLFNRYVTISTKENTQKIIPINQH